MTKLNRLAILLLVVLSCSQATAATEIKIATLVPQNTAWGVKIETGRQEIATRTEGRVKLKIPAETQSGKLFRLRGKGVKSVQSNSAGDLLCRVMIETPVNLNAKQKELLREFDESMRASKRTHDPKASSWLDSVKSFFEDIKP